MVSFSSQLYLATLEQISFISMYIVKPCFFTVGDLFTLAFVLKFWQYVKFLLNLQPCHGKQCTITSFLFLGTAACLCKALFLI